MKKRPSPARATSRRGRCRPFRAEGSFGRAQFPEADASGYTILLRSGLRGRSKETSRFESYTRKRVTDNVPLENYLDRSKPLPATGKIELQHHGKPIMFRYLYKYSLRNPNRILFAQRFRDRFEKSLLGGVLYVNRRVDRR